MGPTSLRWWWLDDDDLVLEPGTVVLEVDVPERNVYRLLGPNGETLSTVSDTPPVGFHQGSRSTP